MIILISVIININRKKKKKTFGKLGELDPGHSNKSHYG